MILAYHLILSAYGFWLPNDPRGSWSSYVGSRQLYAFGPATKTDTRRSVAAQPHDAQLRRAAKQALLRPPVIFTGLQARAIARGMGDFFIRCQLTVPAFAIMPDHLHLVVLRQDFRIEHLANLLKGAATRQLLAEGLHPFPQRDAKGRLPHIFARDGWYVFLHTEADLARAIRYVESNPLRAGLKRQTWPFVTPQTARPKLAANRTEPPNPPPAY